MISFIVPAYNEALEIESTLAAVRAAAQAVGEPFEIVVVNDASTDDTAVRAEAAGRLPAGRQTRVISVSLRRISAVRNAGAREAKGEILFFIDADTRLNENVLRAALAELRAGAVGGGAMVRFSEPVGWTVRLSLWLFSIIYGRLLHWAAGCCFFARREDFEAVGGFDERYYASEEIWLSRALKRRGRFVIVREAVTTSARKLHTHSAWQIIPFGLRFLRYGPGMLRQRRGLDWWYDGRRSSRRQNPNL